MNPRFTHRRAPLISVPIFGTIGNKRSTMPSRPIVYVYASSCRTSRTNASVATSTPSPIASHTACSVANSGCSRAVISR